MKFSKSIFLFFIIINGCSNSFEPTETFIEPHTIGNSWTYHYTLRSLADNKILQEETATNVVSTKEIFGNETWYGISLPSKQPDLFRTNRSNGLWHDGGVNTPTLLALYPTKVGERYLLDSVDSTRYYLVTESVNTKITVAAGTFSCYVYNNIKVVNGKIDCTCSHRSYYRPGIGMVKLEMITENYHTIFELLKYEIK